MLSYSDCKELFANITDAETVENEDDFGPSKMDTPNNSPKSIPKLLIILEKR